MLHSRLRPIPRRNPAAPNLEDEDPGHEDEESLEDLFSAIIPHLFPDDTQSFHGDPGQHLIYSSPRYGDLQIMVPAYPGTNDRGSDHTAAPSETGEESGKHIEDGRKLFAHFLWSAAMVVAEGIEDATGPRIDMETTARQDAREMWHVEGEKVLELGAGMTFETFSCGILQTRKLTSYLSIGAALPSLICALAKASTVVATDHPSSPALCGAMAFNLDYNLRNHSQVTTKISVQPHEWGAFDTPFAQQNKGAFTRIIAADCFWMRTQHLNLVRSLQWFLAPGGKVWVVAGFHTGRAIVAGFFETALEHGLEVERIFERDLVGRKKNDEQIRREWVTEREGEGPENRTRWCVVAVLKQR